MYSDENYIKITKIKDNESIEIHQNYVRLRESTHNKLMAFNIKAPLFETAEIERFFDSMIFSCSLFSSFPVHFLLFPLFSFFFPSCPQNFESFKI